MSFRKENVEKGRESGKCDGEGKKEERQKRTWKVKSCPKAKKRT
jgi:hypothetical protein